MVSKRNGVQDAVFCFARRRERQYNNMTTTNFTSALVVVVGNFSTAIVEFDISALRRRACFDFEPEETDSASQMRCLSLMTNT
jgi:hypothetical protein